MIMSVLIFSKPGACCADEHILFIWANRMWHSFCARDTGRQAPRMLSGLLCHIVSASPSPFKSLQQPPQRCWYCGRALPAGVHSVGTGKAAMRSSSIHLAMQGMAMGQSAAGSQRCSSCSRASLSMAKAACPSSGCAYRAGRYCCSGYGLSKHACAPESQRSKGFQCWLLIGTCLSQSVHITTRMFLG